MIPENIIRINGIDVMPGERKLIKLDVSKLPSGTKIHIDAHVFRSFEPGPCILIVGGVHGDEINGIQIVRKGVENRVFENLRIGSVIAIPLLNVFGFINFSRDVPDGKDVNRSFPGTLKGSLASRVARAVTKEILPNANFLLDFHTGGSSRYNLPQIRYSVLDPVARDLAYAFSPPVILQKTMIARSFRKVAFENKIPTIVYEGGESVRLDGFSIERGYEGMLRVLNHLGILDIQMPNRESIFHFNKTSWIRSPRAGLFIWTKKSGSHICKGEPVGVIKDPQGYSSHKVSASRDGFIIGHNNASVVHVGDALFHIAYDQ
jgi:predicted deacylase